VFLTQYYCGNHIKEDEMGRASASGQGQMAHCCEHSNELPSSTKCREFLDYLTRYILSSQEGLYSVELVTVY
jgi:hypothetical protein